METVKYIDPEEGTRVRGAASNLFNLHPPVRLMWASGRRKGKSWLNRSLSWIRGF